MPIRQIDLIMTAPKTQEASQHRQAEMNKSNNAQAQLNTQFNGEIKHNLKQTVKTLKSENKEYRYDEEKRGKNQSQGQSKRGKKDEESNKQDSDHKFITRNSIDIKI